MLYSQGTDHSLPLVAMLKQFSLIDLIIMKDLAGSQQTPKHPHSHCNKQRHKPTHYKMFNSHPAIQYLVRSILARWLSRLELLANQQDRVFIFRHSIHLKHFQKCNCGLTPVITNLSPSIVYPCLFQVGPL